MLIVILPSIEFKSKCLKMLLEQEVVEQFRRGCHGLRVDKGRWENSVHLNKQDRLCLVCKLARLKSSQHVEDEHHFIFDCPLYSDCNTTVTLEPDMQVLFPFQQTSSVSGRFASLGCEPHAWLGTGMITACTACWQSTWSDSYGMPGQDH